MEKSGRDAYSGLDCLFDLLWCSHRLSRCWLFYRLAGKLRNEECVENILDSVLADRSSGVFLEMALGDWI